jgi:hypothetical protein
MPSSRTQQDRAYRTCLDAARQARTAENPADCRKFVRAALRAREKCAHGYRRAAAAAWPLRAMIERDEMGEFERVLRYAAGTRGSSRSSGQPGRRAVAIVAGGLPQPETPGAIVFQGGGGLPSCRELEGRCSSGRRSVDHRVGRLRGCRSACEGECQTARSNAPCIANSSAVNHCHRARSFGNSPAYAVPPTLPLFQRGRCR